MGQAVFKEYSVCVIISGHKLAGGWGAGDAAPPLLSLHDIARGNTGTNAVGVI